MKTIYKKKQPLKTIVSQEEAKFNNASYATLSSEQYT